MIYFFNKWHNGDFITQLMLIQKIQYLYPELDVGCCCYQHHAYMLEGMNIDKVELGRGTPEIDEPFYAAIRSKHKDAVIINTWLGQFDDTHDHCWKNVVNVYNRVLLKNYNSVGPPPFVTDYEVQFVKFLPSPDIQMNDQKVNIYLNNGRPISAHSEFVSGFEQGLSHFNNLDFYITSGTPFSNLKNIKDCSKMNLVELSSVSNRCDFIFGRGSGPFFNTFTYNNIHKQRFLLNFYNRVGQALLNPDEWPFRYKNDKVSNIKNVNELYNVLAGINRRLE